MVQNNPTETIAGKCMLYFAAEFTNKRDSYCYDVLCNFFNC